MFTRRQLLLMGGLAAAAVGLCACSRGAVATESLRSDASLRELPLESTAGVDVADQLDGIFPGGFAAQFCQQVKLMVSAKGTVGAGVTEVAVAESASVTEMELVVDRPYIMRVLDTRTGWPFFLAIVNDAAAAVTT